MAALTVTVPLVIAKAADESHLYLYKGAILPEDGLFEGEADRLLAEGYVERAASAEEIAAGAAATAAPEGTPDEHWNVDQIDAYAEAHGVTFATGTKKAEKLEQLAQPSV